MKNEVFDRLIDSVEKEGIIHFYHLCQAVVDECIRVCQQRVGNSDYNTGRMHCVNDIKKHFGVE